MGEYPYLLLLFRTDRSLGRWTRHFYKFSGHPFHILTPNQPFHIYLNTGCDPHHLPNSNNHLPQEFPINFRLRITSTPIRHRSEHNESNFPVLIALSLLSKIHRYRSHHGLYCRRDIADEFAHSSPALLGHHLKS